MYGIADQLILGAILALAHYFGESIGAYLKNRRDDLVALASGIFITLLFIDLLPSAAKDNLNFSLILLGFVAYYQVEKHFYLQNPKKNNKNKLEASGFFIANFRNGLAIALIYQNNPQLAAFLLIPLIIAELATATLVSNILENVKNRELYKLGLAFSVIFGSYVGTYLSPSEALANNVLALVIGTMFYFVIRDMLPAYRKKRTGYFLLGVVGMWIVLMLAMA